MTETERMTSINNERFENTRRRVAHAVMLVSRARLASSDTFDAEKIGQAISLLEHASEEMKWACEFFDWNDEPCSLIDDAIISLGEAIAPIVYDKDEADYECEVKAALSEGLTNLSKALGHLVIWNNDNIHEEDI